MVLSYKTLRTKTEAEITVKKSKFIATAAPVSTAEEALFFIAETKKKYKDAAHNCTAYRAGADAAFEKRSDGGEPPGTAGMPILETLRKADVTNAAVVVTRYFGGILLGAGGLARAYSAACSAGIGAAGTVEKRLMQNMSVTVNRSFSGKLKQEVASCGFLLKNVVYGADVTFYVSYPPDFAESAADFCLRCASGGAAIEKLNAEYL